MASSATISLLPVSLSLVHIPRSRIKDQVHPLLRQLLLPSPTFLNVTSNEIELSIFAEHHTLQEFEFSAQQDALNKSSSSRERPPLRNERRKQSSQRGWDPIEVSHERWNVLQIDSHSDGLGTSAVAAIRLCSSKPPRRHLRCSCPRTFCSSRSRWDLYLVPIFVHERLHICECPDRLKILRGLPFRRVLHVIRLLVPSCSAIGAGERIDMHQASGPDSLHTVIIVLDCLSSYRQAQASRAQSSRPLSLLIRTMTTAFSLAAFYLHIQPAGQGTSPRRGHVASRHFWLRPVSVRPRQPHVAAFSPHLAYSLPSDPRGGRRCIDSSARPFCGTSYLAGGWCGPDKVAKQHRCERKVGVFIAGIQSE